MNTDLSSQDLRKIAPGMWNDRLLRLVFPQSDASCNILLANCIEGDEYLSHDASSAPESRVWTSA
jgi:type VI secretion system secreted protein VgrG